MTRLGQMLEEEKQQYAEEYAKKYAERYAEQYEEEAERQMAKRMLFDGVAPETVLKYSTLLSRKDIERILNGANA